MRVIIVIVIALLAPGTITRAQEPTPRVELGPDFSQFQVQYWPADSGLGAHVTVALTPVIAIETRVRAFGSEPLPSVARGGKTFQLFSGARGTFISRGRVTVYGLLMPGLLHYSKVVTSFDNGPVSFGSATHLAIDMGIGATFRLRDHWSVSADLTGPLYGVGGFQQQVASFPGDGSSPAASLFLAVPASVQSTRQLSVGMSYRAGQLARAVEPTHRGGWLVGGDVGAAAYAPRVAIATDVIKAGRIGGFTSFPLARWLDGDIAADVYLHSDNSHSVYEGGRISQAVAGVKVGRREHRVGYFGKIRAGVQTYSEGTIQAPDVNLPPPYPHFVDARRYRPVLDVGTVVETNLSRRFVWRIDVSDLITFYPAKPITIGETTVTDGPYPASDTVMVSTGVAWRVGRER